MKNLHDSHQVEYQRRKQKRTKTEPKEEESEGDSEEGNEEDGDGEKDEPPLKHETLSTPKEVDELEKSARTVFLGNVPSTAVSSKVSFPKLPPKLRCTSLQVPDSPHTKSSRRTSKQPAK
jgi:nucleolar protein 12